MSVSFKKKKKKIKWTNGEKKSLNFKAKVQNIKKKKIFIYKYLQVILKNKSQQKGFFNIIP